MLGELYARMKRHQTNQPIVCLRPFNTFGPYQSDRAIIPELIIKCLMGIPVETTEGRQTREFNYVDNIVDGFIHAAEKNLQFLIRSLILVLTVKLPFVIWFIKSMNFQNLNQSFALEL